MGFRHYLVQAPSPIQIPKSAHHARLRHVYIYISTKKDLLIVPPYNIIKWIQHKQRKQMQFETTSDGPLFAFSGQGHIRRSLNSLSIAQKIVIRNGLV